MSDLDRAIADGPENPSRCDPTGRDERDAAAGRVLDWLEGQHAFNKRSANANERDAIRLLAEHAQRESILDRLVGTIERDHAVRANRQPLASVSLIASLVAELERPDRSTPLTRMAGSYLQILSAELIAQDRRLADLRLKLDPFLDVAGYLESETVGFDDGVELALCVKGVRGGWTEITSLLTFRHFRHLITSFDGEARS